MQIIVKYIQNIYKKWNGIAIGDYPYSAVVKNADSLDHARVYMDVLLKEEIDDFYIKSEIITYFNTAEDHKYFITNSGVKIDLTNITMNQIKIEDIAHHLTRICRYGGALDFDTHYSVAQHCILLHYYAVSNGLSQEVQKNILMHDAAEAYLGDIVSGLKHLLPDYKIIERKIENLICRKYGLDKDVETENIIKELDTRITLDEANKFFPQYLKEFQDQLPCLKPLKIKIYSDTNLMYVTKATFLQLCDNLNIKD